MSLLTNVHILVPTDFSECSERAFAYAKDIAKPLGGTLHLVHVIELIENTKRWGYVYTEIGDVGDLIEKDVTEKLTKRAAELQSEGIAAKIAVLRGSSYTHLTEYAAANGIGMIVMGTHGKTGLERMILGSTTERLLRTAVCPVLAVSLPKEG